jgi:hypothetical protein
VVINGDDIIAKCYADIFNGQVGHFPIKYLGVPVSPSKLKVVDWAPLVEKIGKNWIFGWVVLCP